MNLTSLELKNSINFLAQMVILWSGDSNGIEWMKQWDNLARQ